MHKKKWLIISYFANIEAMAASHHIDDRLPVFQKSGIEIEVLSSYCGKKFSQYPHTRVISILPTGLRYELRHILRRQIGHDKTRKLVQGILFLPLLPFYAVEKLFVRLDASWGWFFSAAPMGLLRALSFRPDCIYSTGGAVSGHVCAWLMSKILHVPLVVEFQDPLPYQRKADNHTEHRYNLKVEKKLLEHAVATVFLTEKAAEKARERVPQAKKVVCVYPGLQTMQPPAVMKRAEKKLVLAHLGSLGGSRNLEVFLQALAAVLAAQPDLTEIIQVQLYGNSEKKILTNIAAFPYSGIITNFGKQPRETAFNAMFAADVLLLIQNTEAVSSETIPSKVYEYLQVGNKILGMVYRNPELANMLQQYGHQAVEADDVEQTKQAILNIVEQFKRGELGKGVKPYDYTPQQAVEKLIALAAA
jgi:glycosyltransferase involved in cell wall biosynthesis